MFNHNAAPSRAAQSKMIRLPYSDISNIQPFLEAELGKTITADNAPYNATPFSFRIAQTFGGVIGISIFVTPRWERASTTAFAIAGGAPTVADSPTPFAPNGWCGDGVTVCRSPTSASRPRSAAGS